MIWTTLAYSLGHLTQLHSVVESRTMARIPVPQRRAALIEAALRVISGKGVAAATTRAIAAEAGMSLASLHYAFESRDDLIAEVIAQVIELQAGAALGVLEPGADLSTTLREAFHAYLAVIAADPPREQAMYELNHYALRTPGLGESARRQYASYYAAAEAVLTAIAEVTGHEWTRPMPQMARILITLTDGISLGWLVDHDTEAAEQVIDFAVGALVALAHPTGPLEKLAS
jgi:AcrR family transcriptional regulator